MLKLLIKLISSESCYALSSESSTATSNSGLLNVFITPDKIFILSYYIKFSSVLLYAQSLDFFAYQSHTNFNTTAVYLFFFNHYSKYLNLFSNKISSSKNILLKNSRFYSTSLTNIFSNYWWLEREASELTYVFFFNKQDNRNLLLEYFTLFKPLLRTFPSFGVYELFYDTFNFNLLHTKPSLQI